MDGFSIAKKPVSKKKILSGNLYASILVYQRKRKIFVLTHKRGEKMMIQWECTSIGNVCSIHKLYFRRTWRRRGLIDLWYHQLLDCLLRSLLCSQKRFFPPSLISRAFSFKIHSYKNWMEFSKKRRKKNYFSAVKIFFFF